MKGYHRIFIVGLFVAGLVGVYADDREDLPERVADSDTSEDERPDDRQHNGSENLRAGARETLLTIEADAAPQPLSHTSRRILKKRSSPRPVHPKLNPQLDWELTVAEKLFKRASEETAREKAAWMQKAKKRDQSTPSKLRQ